MNLLDMKRILLILVLLVLVGGAGAENVTVGVPNSPVSQWNNYATNGNYTTYTLNGSNETNSSYTFANVSGWLNYLQIGFTNCDDCYVKYYTFESNSTHYIIKNVTNIINVSTGLNIYETYNISLNPIWINVGEGLGVYYSNYSNGIARIATNNSATGSKYYQIAGDITLGATSLKSSWSLTNNRYISGYGSTQLPPGEEGDGGSDFPEKIYYIAPNGNNSNNGTSIEHAWENLSYAITSSNLVRPNTTIYILNGTYNDPHGSRFRTLSSNCGNANHAVKVLAYNGTPKIIGSMLPYYGADGYAFTIGESSNFGICENVTISGIEFHNFTKIYDVRQARNITLSHNVFNKSAPSTDLGQVGGFNTAYILYHDNVASNTGYNTLNFVGGVTPELSSYDGLQGYYYIYNNTAIHNNGTQAHGAIQMGSNLSNVYFWNNSQIDTPLNGGFGLYNGYSYTWMNDSVLRDSWTLDSNGLIGGENLKNITAYNMSFTLGNISARYEPIYFKGFVYGYLPTYINHKIRLDNFTFYNNSGSYTTVRFDGGYDQIISNFTFLDQHISGEPDIYFMGLNLSHKLLYPDLDIVQDTNNSQFTIKIGIPGKVAVNYTKNYIFSNTYLGNSTGLVCTSTYCSNIFSEYAANDAYTSGWHLATIQRVNITVRPSQNSGIAWNDSNAVYWSGSNFSNLTIMLGSDISAKTVNFTNQTALYIVSGAENISVINGMANFSSKSSGTYVFEEGAQGAPATPTTVLLQVRSWIII